MPPVAPPAAYDPPSSPNAQASPVNNRRSPLNPPSGYVQNPPSTAGGYVQSPPSNMDGYVDPPPAVHEEESPSPVLPAVDGHNTRHSSEHSKTEPNEEVQRALKSRHLCGDEPCAEDPGKQHDSSAEPQDTVGGGQSQRVDPVPQSGPHEAIPNPRTNSSPDPCLPQGADGHSGYTSGYVSHDAVPSHRNNEVQLPNSSTEAKPLVAKPQKAQNVGYVPHSAVKTEDTQGEERNTSDTGSPSETSSPHASDSSGATAAAGTNGHAASGLRSPAAAADAMATSASGYVPNTEAPHSPGAVSQAAGSEGMTHPLDSKSATMAPMPNGYVTLT